MVEKIPPIVIDGVEIDADTYDPAVAMEFAFLVGQVHAPMRPAETPSPAPTVTVPIFIDYPEVAHLLGISVDALKQRVARGQFPRHAVKRTGRRVQFIRTKVLALAK